MKIALINMPFWPPHMPPLGPAYISAVIKNRGHQVQVFDMNIEAWSQIENKSLWDSDKLHEAQDYAIFHSRIIHDIKPLITQLCKKIVVENFDSIGFSITELNLLGTLYCIKLIKSILPEIKIFCGGPDSYLENDRLMSEVQKGNILAAIFGEAEETVDELFSHWEKGESVDHILGMVTPNSNFELKRIKKRPSINFANLKFPDFSDFKIDLYRGGELPVMMSRGCVATCTFCTEFVTWRNYKIRSASDVYDELKFQIQNYKVNKFFFCDSLINGNIEMLRQLVDLINANQLNLEWNAFARIDKNLTAPFCHDLKKSGCTILRFGLESGSNKVLDLMNKNNNIQDAYMVIRNAYNAGIQIHALFIVGFPGETRKDFFLSQKFIFENRKYLAQIAIGNTLTIPPLAPMGNRPKHYGIKKNPDGSVYFDEKGEWYSEDGSLDPKERYHRLFRMQNFLEALNLHWTPVPRSRLQITGGVNGLILKGKVYLELILFYLAYLRYKFIKPISD